MPAVVISLIIAALAGLFLGAYCWAMADPVPHAIPVAVTGRSVKGDRFTDALEATLGTSLVLHPYPDYGRALAAVDEQQEFAIQQRQPAGVEVDVASAAGASVARVLARSAPAVGRALGIPVQVRDVKPLPATDSQRLALFYITLGSTILGLVGAIQLGVHAQALRPAERIATTVGYSVLGGLWICVMTDWVLGVVRLPFAQSWGICALTMFTAGMIFTAFHTFLGRWAVLPTWLLLVILGNPSSGGAVAWPLLPPVLGFLGRFLPPGASVNAQRNAAVHRAARQARCAVRSVDPESAAAGAAVLRQLVARWSGRAVKLRVRCASSVPVERALWAWPSCVRGHRRCGGSGG
ncbi:ABC transporter permease [Streptomyces olivochromogenes]|uniref:ABC transporter permease n=1 Tax=Streptomyces olivochromogenes TaxID=1963 RepID=UPI001F45EC04|nr:ABC transporter permease [Streptomyces olivochromogenes]MCF3130479.1 ABC transporter permease [Streptomyces olivochromogenes]